MVGGVGIGMHQIYCVSVLQERTTPGLWVCNGPK